MTALCIVLLIGLVIAQALVIWGLKQDICELKKHGDSARVGAAADAINKSTDDLAAAVEKNKL